MDTGNPGFDIGLKGKIWQFFSFSQLNGCFIQKTQNLTNFFVFLAPSNQGYFKQSILSTIRSFSPNNKPSLVQNNSRRPQNLLPHQQQSERTSLVVRDSLPTQHTQSKRNQNITHITI
jgi:hypothetical protein